MRSGKNLSGCARAQLPLSRRLRGPALGNNLGDWPSTIELIGPKWPLVTRLLGEPLLPQNLLSRRPEHHGFRPGSQRGVARHKLI
jgi:hypothetical protein